MHKYLRWAFVAAGLSVPLVVVGFVVYMRNAPLTPAQQLAMQRLAAPTPPVRGRDASDALWLLDLDVPLDRRAEVAAKVRAFESMRGRPGASARDPRQDWPRYPEPPEGGSGTCKQREPGCLAYVAENRALVAAVLAEHAAALAAQREIAEFDGFRRGVATSDQMQYPSFETHRRLLTTAIAHRFTSGGQASALEAACRDLAGWRRVGGDSDDLVTSMVGVARVREDLLLLADMLAKLPKETPLPAPCEQALAPSADYEYDLCPAIRSEFVVSRQVREQYAQLEEKVVPMWAIDWRRFEARVAEDMGRVCDPAVLPRQRADAKAAGFLVQTPRCTKWERRADWFGCVLFEAANADYSKYLDRRTDMAQMLALMRTVVWLRAQVGSKEEVGAALERVPAELGLLRTPRYDLEHDRVSIVLHDASRGPEFAIAAGAEPRRTTRPKLRCCSRRPSRNLASLD